MYYPFSNHLFRYVASVCGVGHLEASYAHQMKKPMIPLMVEDGYTANGWLGFMLGSNLWYGFFGCTLATEDAFNQKVGELAVGIDKAVGLRPGGGKVEANNCARAWPLPSAAIATVKTSVQSPQIAAVANVSLLRTQAADSTSTNPRVAAPPTSGSQGPSRRAAPRSPTKATHPLKVAPSPMSTLVELKEKLTMIQSLQEEGLLKGSVAELVLLNYLEESGSIGAAAASAATTNIVTRMNGGGSLWDQPM
jgi:hypothetical protein